MFVRKATRPVRSRMYYWWGGNVGSHKTVSPPPLQSWLTGSSVSASQSGNSWPSSRNSRPRRRRLGLDHILCAQAPVSGHRCARAHVTTRRLALPPRRSNIYLTVIILTRDKPRTVRGSDRGVGTLALAANVAHKAVDASDSPRMLRLFLGFRRRRARPGRRAHFLPRFRMSCCQRPRLKAGHHDNALHGSGNGDAGDGDRDGERDRDASLQAEPPRRALSRFRHQSKGCVDSVEGNERIERSLCSGGAATHHAAPKAKIANQLRNAKRLRNAGSRASTDKRQGNS